jgi:Cu(I)/Ag(I) efflux system membrane fusion protein
VDELVVAYLELSQALGAQQQSDDPVGVDRLASIAEMSEQHAAAEAKPLVAVLLKSIQQMKGKTLADQRRAFVAVSSSMIALIDRTPPSSKVADRLYVMHCPMAFEEAGADWIQTTEKVANPFYAKQMKNCGEVKRTIAGKR